MQRVETFILACHHLHDFQRKFWILYSTVQEGKFIIHQSLSNKTKCFKFASAIGEGFAAMLGGQLENGNAPDGGARLTVRLPLGTRPRPGGFTTAGDGI